MAKSAVRVLNILRGFGLGTFFWHSGDAACDGIFHLISSILSLLKSSSIALLHIFYVSLVMVGVYHIWLGHGLGTFFWHSGEAACGDIFHLISSVF